MSHGVVFHFEIHILNSVPKCVHGPWHSQCTIVKEFTRHPPSQSASPPASQPTSQPLSERTSPPASQSTSQPACSPTPAWHVPKRRSRQGSPLATCGVFCVRHVTACLNHQLSQQFSLYFPQHFSVEKCQSLQISRFNFQSVDCGRPNTRLARRRPKAKIEAETDLKFTKVFLTVLAHALPC